jgi:uncharacterized protein (DUF924 family)
MSEFEKVLNFWFGQLGGPDYGKPRRVWFAKKPAFDREVRRFLNHYERAAAGQLDDWKHLPHSCLALILLLDQFPRNMFRGTAKAFATDARAIAHATHAVANRFDRELLPVQRWFIYFPFEHSEDLNAQRQSVGLFQQLSDDPDSATTIYYAIRHQAAIERFGRFPHRNQILGRETTPEEAEFLQQAGSSF